MNPKIKLPAFCDAVGVNVRTVRSHIARAHWLPGGPSFDNLHEITIGDGKHVVITPVGALRAGTALRLIEAGIFSPDAFQIALRSIEIGTTPETWGDDPPQLKPWNYRAPGRIFAVGRTLLAVDPRRRDPLTGLASHRVICTADPAFKKSDALLTAPDEGQVEGDPDTVILIDLTALGHRLCAGLGVDPAEHLITPAPEGGWS